MNPLMTLSIEQVNALIEQQFGSMSTDQFFQRQADRLEGMEPPELPAKHIVFDSRIALVPQFQKAVHLALHGYAEELGLTLHINALSLYGSVTQGKTSPNDLDVFAQVDVDVSADTAVLLGFEFDEIEFDADPVANECYQRSRFSAELLHGALHGEHPGMTQPVFMGLPIDICVNTRSFADYWGSEPPMVIPLSI